jgi:hypothetical protein
MLVCALLGEVRVGVRTAAGSSSRSILTGLLLSHGVLLLFVWDSLDGVCDCSMVGCKDVWCVAIVVVLMFSVCRPCASRVHGNRGRSATAAPAPATLEAEPRGVRHRTFSRDDPGTPACARYLILASSATFAHTTTVHSSTQLQPCRRPYHVRD